MEHDDRELDAASGAPADPNEPRAEDEPREPDAAHNPDAQDPAPSAAAAEDFENAPSLTREPEADEPADEPVGEAGAAPGASQEETQLEEASGPPPREAEAYPASPAHEAEPSGAAAHSVPATQMGESTQCPRCGTENRPGVAFCRNCGQRLVAAGVATTLERPSAAQGTQACPRCGTVNRAGVAFCQNCGANLRATAQPAPGYVPPAASAGSPPAPAATRQAPSGGAVLGPIVLLVGAIGVATAWVLPFAYVNHDSLWQRSFGAVGGYGAAFWNDYSAIGGGIADKAYFGFAAAAPILVAVLVLLVIAGFLRAAPGGLQVIGLLVATVWAIGLIVLFVALEIVGNWSSDIVSVLRLISPAGIIFLLASLIVLIGCATRFARS